MSSQSLCVVVFKVGHCWYYKLTSTHFQCTEYLTNITEVSLGSHNMVLLCVCVYTVVPSVIMDGVTQIHC